MAAAGGGEGDVVAAGWPALVQEGELPLGRGHAPEGGRPQAQPAVVVAGVPGHERALQGRWAARGPCRRWSAGRKKRSPPGSVKSMKGPGRSVSRWGERQPVGPVRVLEGPPPGGHGRPGGGRAPGRVVPRVRPCQTIVPARATAMAANTTGSRTRRRRAPEETGSPGIGTGGTGGSRPTCAAPPPWGRRAVVAPARRRIRLGTGGVSPAASGERPATGRRGPRRRPASSVPRSAAAGAPVRRRTWVPPAVEAGGARASATAGADRGGGPARRPGAAGAGAGPGWPGWPGP